MMESKSIDEINDDINESYKLSFGDNTDTSENSVLGNIKAPIAIVLGYTHQLINFLRTQIDPRTAQDTFLDIVCSLTNVYRIKNSKGQGEITFIGDTGTVIPQGTEVSTNDNVIFVTKESFVMSSSSYKAAIESIEYGIKSIEANTITNIDTTPGISAVTNEMATEAGELRETNAQLRARREKSTAINSNSTTEAMWATLLAVKGVSNAFVFESGDGKTIPLQGTIPPAYFYVLVDGGIDTDIVKAIAKTKTGGIPTIGTQSANYTDSTGKEVTYYFDRPLEVPIEIEVDISIVDSRTYPLNGVANIQAALMNHLTKDINIGGAIYYNRLISAINDVAGMEISEIRIKKGAADFVSTTVQMAINEIGLYEEEKIVVRIL